MVEAMLTAGELFKEAAVTQEKWVPEWVLVGIHTVQDTVTSFLSFPPTLISLASIPFVTWLSGVRCV